MIAAIDFYFDFSSPYGFLASQKIEALAQKHGRAVDWHPVLLGVIFKETAMAPLTAIPLKGDYSRRDFARSARFHGGEVPDSDDRCGADRAVAEKSRPGGRGTRREGAVRRVLPRRDRHFRPGE